MGSCGSKSPEVVQSEEIAKELKNEKKLTENEIKLLLLGAGESGKSTIFKQMKIIHKNGYSSEEKMSFKALVYSNVIQCIQALIRACETLNIDLGDLKESGEKIMALTIKEKLNPTLANDILAMWNAQPIQDAVARASEFQLPDAAAYFLPEVVRLSEENYVPTEADILHTRVRTTGIVETSWEINEVMFRMYDVGGQRNERRKWIHCFDKVTAVLFVASLSEFDQTLVEDQQQNRMKEALSLFEYICDSRWFRNTHIILFLNKTDLFEQKLKSVELSHYFPEFTGNNTPEEGAEFITKKFDSLNKLPNRTIYTQLTCATSTDNIRFVFSAVKDIVMQKNLQNSGF
eukprot:c19463_g1_i2.p1 GENE.c19463_g1_i2~~c19463_g1_i2.p1  ORF type:complete len:346 (+),score=90.09 c19463_g1_i2:50-1087(+)